MKYLLTIYNTDEFVTRMETDLKDEFEAAHQDLQRELTASGELVDTAELSVTDARVVRTDSSGSRDVTDGPFTESKEFVGGYYLVDVASIERAVDLASRFVEARFAPVEVRRIGA
ncbi:YciI family protein [Leifsonia sp. NPDC102414]|uniref:YciI family protein n=1 Tax=Leifsonia sp. NPDC102414 TaxID=3364124 RepID=UPI0038189742